MEPKNNIHSPQNNIAPFASHVMSGSDTNGADIFSTLRNLATAGTSAFPTTTSHMLFQTQFPTNSTNWPNATTNSWLDQAKLSLFPMYGLLQSSGNSGTQNNAAIPFMVDQNIQQAAVAETARQAATTSNIIGNLHNPFGSLYAAGINLPYSDGGTTSTIQSPLADDMRHQEAAQMMRTYSHSNSSTSQTPQSSGGPQSQSQMIISPPQTTTKFDYNIQQEPADESLNHSSIEEFTDFDLQEFENLLMEKPSTTFTQSQQQQVGRVFSQTETEQISLGDSTKDLNQIPQATIPSRGDELANADMELDRLVSLVASQNMPSVAESKSIVEGNTIFTQNQQSSTSKATFVQHSSILLDAPQFTPPDSPLTFDESTRPDKKRNSIFDTLFDNQLTPQKTLKSSPSIDNLHSTSKKTCIENRIFDKEQKQQKKLIKIEDSLLLIPKDQIKVNPIRHLSFAKKRNDVNRVPIYKQNVLSTSGPSLEKNDSFFTPDACTSQNSRRNDAIKKSAIDDAYNFDDEFAENPLLNQPVNQENHQVSFEKRTSEEIRVKRKYIRRKESKNTNILAVEEPSAGKETRKLTPFLAEQIRTRRFGNSFIHSEIANDDNIAVSDEFPIPTCTLKNTDKQRTSAAKERNIPHQQPLPLPKLIIRIPRRDSREEPAPAITHIETIEPGNKRKKKKKRKEKDLDWTETDEYKFVRHKKHKEKKHKKEHKRHRKRPESIDNTIKFNANEENPSQEQSDGSHYEHDEPIVTNGDELNFTTRLHYFERPTERPKRGIFLLAKIDMFKKDCSLWRIDSQNLLQKYLPIILEDATIAYKNSQTYSGWSEQYVDDYMAIKVEYIKQSRSDNIVRPLVPLQELFPAINMQFKDEHNVHKKVGIKRTEESLWNPKDQQLRSYFNTFLTIMCKHCITLEFIQNVKQSNDWKCLCALTEIENQQNLRIDQILAEQNQWIEPFVNALRDFPQIFFVCDLDVDTKMEHPSCQACLVKSLDVRQAVQLFAQEIYDFETLVPKRIANSESACTIDFYLCHRCADAALKYHRIYHLRYSIFKTCEAKIESISTEYPEMSIAQIIEKCLIDKEWVDDMYNESMDALYLK